MRQRAFTFIELLVVMANIAVLAAILITLVTGARERSDLATCIGHNGQLGTAFRIYLQDTDEVLPRWSDASNVTWDTYLLPQVRSTAPFTCPSDRSASVRKYAYTDRPVRAYALPRNVSGMPLWRMKAPARTVLLYEKGAGRMGEATSATGEWFGQSSSGVQDVRFQQSDPNKWGMPHNLGKVFLYVDGHAQWHKAIVSKSDDNPFGYDYPPSPVAGQYRLGYCGDYASGPLGQASYGANLPH